MRSGKAEVARWSADSSCPIAITRPPEDKGDFVRIGEAEAGRGFRFTGGEVLPPLALDVWVWNAEREGMSTEGYPNGFQRGSRGAEFVGMAGAMPSPSVVESVHGRSVFSSYALELRRSMVHAHRDDHCWVVESGQIRGLTDYRRRPAGGTKKEARTLRLGDNKDVLPYTTKG